MEGEGGLGEARGGKAPSFRRVSSASESTPLFLHAPVEEGNEPLAFGDESIESQYFPSRWKATLEATVSKVFWDGFGWERFAFLSAKGLGQGPTTLVRCSPLPAAAAVAAPALSSSPSDLPHRGVTHSPSACSPAWAPPCSCS
jgi:hypothetical protein